MALGSRGAYLIDRYFDQDTSGLGLITTNDLIEIATKPLSKILQLQLMQLVIEQIEMF